MAKIKKVPESENKYQLQFFCPGCKREHAINDTWEFDENYDKPTISPSVLWNGGWYVKGKWEKHICHSFIKEGKIQFLDDCTHKLAGQTVDLPEIK